MRQVKQGDRVFIHELDQFGTVKSVTDKGRVEQVEVKGVDGNPKVINVVNMVVDFAKVIFPKANIVLSVLQRIGNFFFNRKKEEN